MRKFLVTGLPRTRSAWFAALLGATHSPSAQDYQWAQAVCDPSAACLYPDTALSVWKSSPIVVVHRDAEQAYYAFQKWAQVPIAPTFWRRVVANYNTFCEKARSLNTRFVTFADLDNYAQVNAIHVHLTGEALPRERFDLFNGLRIEQHKDKAQIRCPQ